MDLTGGAGPLRPGRHRVALCIDRHLQTRGVDVGAGDLTERRERKGAAGSPRGDGQVDAGRRRVGVAGGVAGAHREAVAAVSQGTERAGRACRDPRIRS